MKIYSPVKGKIKPLENVNDDAFSEKMMGDGIAIVPSTGSVFSPVDGVVSMLFPTCHAIGLKSDDDVEVLLHIGIDTVEMDGVGFSSYVKQGDHVEIGDPLITFDLDKVKEKYESDIIVIITNTASFKSISKTNSEDISVFDELLSVE